MVNIGRWESVKFYKIDEQIVNIDKLLYVTELAANIIFVEERTQTKRN